MMQVTKILMDEHQKILNELLQLEQILSKPIEDNIEKIANAIRFIRLYADKFHHAKEEAIYFEWMINKNPMYETGPIHCMLEEHNSGRNFVSKADAALIKLRLGQTDHAEIVKSNLLSFITLLREHIHKEDNVLYQMAEKENLNSQDGDQLMLQRFLDVEKEFETILLFDH